MGTDETNVDLVVLVIDSYYQSKLIISNVENYPSVANQSGFRILCFQIMWRIPDFPFTSLYQVSKDRSASGYRLQNSLNGLLAIILMMDGKPPQN